MSDLQEFRQYQLSENPDGTPLELARTEDEVHCLAFDRERQFFVELHVLSRDWPDVDSEGVFLDHVRAAKRIRHPRVVRVLDAGQDEGTPFYATEFVDGEPLPAFLKRAAPLPPGLAVELAIQLLEGLEALRPTPLLLGGCDLLAARVALGPVGGGTSLCVKLADIGLGRVGETADGEAGAWEHRCTLNVCRVLVAAFRGDFSMGPDDLMDEPVPGIPEALRRVIASVADDPGTRLAGLIRDLEAAIPEPVEAASRIVVPRGRLVEQFHRQSVFQAAVGEGFGCGSVPPASGSAYSVVALAPDGGVEPSVQFEMLPPSRFAPGSFSRTVQRAMSETGGITAAHLTAPTALWGDPAGDFYSVPYERGATLGECLDEVPGGLPAKSILEILEAVHAALVEAESAGFPVWGLSPAGIRWTGQGFDPEGGLVPGTWDLSIAVCPSVAILLEPWRFHPDGVAPPKQPEPPDAWRGFLALAIELAHRDREAGLREAMEAILLEEADKEEVRGGGTAIRRAILARLRRLVESAGRRPGAGTAGFPEEEPAAAVAADRAEPTSAEAGWSAREAPFQSPPRSTRSWVEGDAGRAIDHDATGEDDEADGRSDAERPALREGEGPVFGSFGQQRTGDAEAFDEPEDNDTPRIGGDPMPSYPDEDEEVDDGGEASPGLLEALFPEGGDLDQWNPVARSVLGGLHADDDGLPVIDEEGNPIDPSDGDADLLEEAGRSGGGRGTLVAILLLILLSAALAAAVAHFTGRAFWMP